MVFNYIADLKKKARENLTNYWGKAVGVTAIYLVISMILDSILKKAHSNITILETIVLVFFSLGMIKFYFNVRKKDARIEDIFSQSKLYFKGLIVSLVQAFASIILLLLSVCIPWDHVTNEAVMGIYGLVVLILTIASIVVALMFALSTIILVDKPDSSIAYALKESSRLMMGNKWKIILLFLSFIGWFLLSIISFGIGLLWLIPYVQMTTIEFYLDLKEKKG